MNVSVRSIVTVTLNPAIDRLIEVDGLAGGGHLAGQLIDRVPAGKGVNVSRCLSMLGLSSIATGFVGREEFTLFERVLARLGVTPQFVAVDGHTRENITLLDHATHAETHIRDEGFTPSSGDLDRLRGILGKLARRGVLVIFSGSLPPGVKPAFVVELVDMLLSHDVSVAVDGSGELLNALRDRPLALVSPNRSELAEMFGRELNTEHSIVTAGQDLAKTTDAVLVSCGAEGAYLFTEGAAFRAACSLRPDQVRSTVGCGDALLAGFIAARLRGEFGGAALQRAVSVGEAAAMQAAPGVIVLDAVDELFKSCAVTDLLGERNAT